MHLLQDENGNPVPHGHEGRHCHSHEEEHCRTHEEGRCGSGPGDACPHAKEGQCHHDQTHHHDHGSMETKEQMAALLSYMLKHNQSHAAELDRMAGKLAGQGLAVASEQVRKAVDEYAKGNLYLSLALSSVKEL